MFNIEEMYFHGISFMDWKYVGDVSHLELLESVLSDHFILTRDSLWKKHPAYAGYLNEVNWNGNDRVSIARHFNKDKSRLENLKSYEDFGFDFVSDAYSIIINPILLNEFSWIQKGSIGEYQVMGDIPLSYMVGIGCPNYFERIFVHVDYILKNENCTLNRIRDNYYVRLFRQFSDIHSFIDEGVFGFGYRNYDKLESLLNKYKYDVLVVDPITGCEWSSKEECVEKMESLRERSLEKKLILK